MRIDFELSGHGTVYLFRPITRAARVWVDEHLPADATWWCGAVVVEHRYIGRSSAVPSATGWWCGDEPLRQAPAARADERVLARERTKQ